jgi:hypothetical protein
VVSAAASDVTAGVVRTLLEGDWTFCDLANGVEYPDTWLLDVAVADPIIEVTAGADQVPVGVPVTPSS